VLLPATDQGPRKRTQSDLHDIFGRGEIVLVVEDEDGIREVARRILARRGYEVLTAASGADAVELARSHDGSIDLLITDVIMPRMMGKEVAETIMAMRPSTQIMYMSGYAHPILGSSQGLPAGTILIEKPFTERALLSKVREALAGSAPPRDG
jgi:two-component system, cell cycle sensor histidine kinase and response regulator CckA